MQRKRTLAFLLALAIAAAGFVPAWAAGGVTQARTPRHADEAQLRFSFELKDPLDWDTGVSDIVLAAGSIFVAVGDELLRISQAGQLQGRTPLAGEINFTARPLAHNGVVYVPLNHGRLQAINATTMQTLWTTNPLPEIYLTFTDFDADWNPIVVTAYLNQQATTSVAVGGGRLFFGTACADWENSYYGTFLAVDAATGEVLWTHVNEDAGYYWAGAALSGSAVIFAGDDGVLTSLHQATGAVIDTLDLGAAVRTGIVIEGSYAFAVTRNGRLHRVALHTNGSFGAATSVQFAADSTSTPAIAGGMAYVGGMAADWSGVLAVVDTATMQVTASAAAPAAVQGTPLVSTAHATPHVYFTANAEPGALYVFNGTAASVLFTPPEEHRNFCIASAVAGGDGTLYYTNDSGRLFAIERIEEERTWLDKLPNWLGFIRNMSSFCQGVVYYVFFGWLLDVIVP